YVINLLIIYSLIIYSSLFFFNDPATTDIYTLSLHDALPICSHKFVALELSQDVAVPLRFPFAEPSILFFEQLQVENLHTLHNNFGLYFQDNEMFIGVFQQEQSSIELKLNEWKSQHFTEENKACFWKLYAKFEKII